MRLTGEILQAAAAKARLEPASLAIVPLRDGDQAAVLRPDLRLYPASMIKVPLAAAALLETAEGRLDALDSTVVIEEGNMTANDAESPLVPGYRATLRELVHLAVSRSDNVATNELFDLVGRSRATEIARERFGLRATAFARKLSGGDPLIDDAGWDGIHRNAHPASDAARLFASIAANALPLCEVLLAALEAQVWNEKLSRGLREGDRFAHKTGDTSEVTHDGGILTTDSGHRYVVVAYTGLPSGDEHNARFAPFMEEVRAYL